VHELVTIDTDYDGVLFWLVAVLNLARIHVIVTQKFRDFLYCLQSYYPGSYVVLRVTHDVRLQVTFSIDTGYV
jgi:hypothetical protein